MAEIGCQTSAENGAQSFLRTQYFNFRHDEDNENVNKGMTNKNNIMLSCTENGWTSFEMEKVRKNLPVSSTQDQDVTPALVCIKNTCGAPNVVIVK